MKQLKTYQRSPDQRHIVYGYCNNSATRASNYSCYTKLLNEDNEELLSSRLIKINVPNVVFCTLKTQESGLAGQAVSYPESDHWKNRINDSINVT